MADVKLQAELRDNFGKGFARRTRAAGRVPAVLYGHGTDPVHVSLDGHATMMALKNPNALVEIDGEGVKEMAVAREVQRHPVRRDILHVDFLIVKRGEKIEVDVPVVTVGEAGPGTMVSVPLQQVTVLADATKLPEQIEVDIEGLGVNDDIYVRDLKLPEGVEVQNDEELMVVNIAPELTEEQLEAELESEAVDEDVAANTGAPSAEEAEALEEEAEEAGEE